MRALKLTLVQRIELTVGLLLGLMLVAGGFTAWSVYGIRQQARQTVESDLVQLLRMSIMQKRVSQARRAEKDVSIDLLMKMDRVPQRIAEWKQHVAEANVLMRTVSEAEFHPRALDSIQQGAESSRPTPRDSAAFWRASRARRFSIRPSMKRKSRRT